MLALRFGAWGCYGDTSEIHGIHRGEDVRFFGFRV